MRRGGAAARLVPAAWILVVTALAVTVWVGTHPPVPQHPDSDLYTHLGVARHLAAGDGFQCDVAYPLSYAFPFARSTPQPLIHRTPGYPLLLTLPAAVAGDDRAGAMDGVRLLHLGMLAGIVAVGLAELRRRGRPGATLLWLPVLLASPLLDMTLRWHQVESVVALVLLGHWALGGGRLEGARGGLAAGLLAGGVALLRAELFWLPWLWSLVRDRRAGRRWWLAAAVSCLVLTTPWAVRNAAVTGHPFFSLQAHAEHLKETSDHPGMSIYLGLEPESLRESLERDPGLLLRKGIDGALYQVARLDNWLPWPLLVFAVGGALLTRLRRRPFYGGHPEDAPGRGRPLLGVSWAALVLLYAPFSHDLRHVAVLLPVALLELSVAAHDHLGTLRPFVGRPRERGAVLAAAAAVLILITPARMPGWQTARDDAVRAWLDAGAAVARAQTAPSGPIITDHAAVFWLAGRAGMVMPGSEADLAAVRSLVPDLAEAPIIHGAPHATP